jgi:Zn-dependent protease with chaperone function
MRSLLKPLVMVLAIPVLATAFSILARNDWEARWQSTLVRQLAAQRMRPDARLIARYSLSSLCGDPRSANRLPPCRTYRWHSGVILASAGVGGAGFLLLGGLLLASRLCGVRRAWLTALFKPSLVAAAAGVAGIGLLNAVLAMAAVGAVTSYLFGNPVDRVSLSTLLVAGTAAVVWGLGMAVAAFSVIRRPTVTLIGRVLDPAGQAALVEEVGRLAAVADAARPGHLVACLAPAFFVTELNVACLDGDVKGRTLCLSLPLLRILTVGEFRALLAHEFAHFSKEDEGYARRVAPFYAGASRALDRLAAQAHGIMKPAVIPPRALMAFFLDGVREAADSGASREFDADRFAAAAAGGAELASALVKMQAFGAAWYTVAGAMFDAVAVRSQFVNASALFQEVVTANAGREHLLGIGGQHQDHPTDRHPALAERLTALNLDLGPVADAALMTRPSPAAVSLIAGHEALERELSASEHQLIAATGADATALAG